MASTQSEEKPTMAFRQDNIEAKEGGHLRPVPVAERIKQQHADLYAEALEKYGVDDLDDTMTQ
jgi:hypothetical protein